MKLISTVPNCKSPYKRLRLDPNVTWQIIQKLDQNQINEGTIHSLLIESIDIETPSTGTLLHVTPQTSTRSQRQPRRRHYFPQPHCT